MEMVININYKNLKGWKDSIKRAEHVFDRMRSRGIFTNQIEEAVRKGAKNLRDDGSIITEYRWFKVIYREMRVDDIRKIYPITVMEA